MPTTAHYRNQAYAAKACGNHFEAFLLFKKALACYPVSCISSLAAKQDKEELQIQIENCRNIILKPYSFKGKSWFNFILSLRMLFLQFSEAKEDIKPLENLLTNFSNIDKSIEIFNDLKPKLIDLEIDYAIINIIENTLNKRKFQ